MIALSTIPLPLLLLGCTLVFAVCLSTLLLPVVLIAGLPVLRGGLTRTSTPAAKDDGLAEDLMAAFERLDDRVRTLEHARRSDRAASQPTLIDARALFPGLGPKTPASAPSLHLVR